MSKFDEVFQPTPIEDIVEHARNAVHLNGGDIKHELERIPSDLAHYGFEFARAHRRYLAAKVNVETVHAARYLVIREDLTLTEGKVTEAMVEKRVTADASVAAARAELIEAEYEREQMKSISQALMAKREALTSLALLARAELAGSHGFRDPRVEDERA